MFITRKADYAIRSVLYLTGKGKDLATISEISESIQVPRLFLAKILQQLAGSGIVISERGLKGGFRLAKDPVDITLLEVIEMIQGISASNQCAVDEDSCKLSSKCAVHPVWVKIRKMIENELKSKNFRELADNIEA